jgi:hypothetical protein
MAKAPALITSPKVKKLAQKASKSPSMLTTEETRELGASVMAFLSPPQAVSSVAPKAPVKKLAAKRS